MEVQGSSLGNGYECVIGYPDRVSVKAGGMTSMRLRRVISQGREGIQSCKHPPRTEQDIYGDNATTTCNNYALTYTSHTCKLVKPVLIFIGMQT